ncbi:MipA/OmpV family protein [Gilvimarinus sp. SDUM040013]|uniref:MipA/OmpV family protein n=1 Tax=Gilvimarinus gilvus TaxID=3058038 RepID=A0ABU4RVM0_9GAMM|nr:MipA/OmpV family protein [Gilvimarinus sp. SDUM040013]MDO3387639.1 MipA/OmpV family protein [Gilvimarinus sp. SDUM040013]MDX6848920.1 MipA/OmpV family protein [Gilvimarinus sp. SDUM040013]
MKIKLYLFMLTAMLVSKSIVAADIVSDVRAGGDGKSSSYEESYIELGVSLVVANNPWDIAAGEEYDDHDLNLDFDVYGQLKKNNFLIEVTQGTMDGLNLGYTFLTTPTWQVDFLAGSLNGSYEIGKDYKIDDNDTESERNRKIYERNRIYVGTGLRVTHYWGKYVVQARILNDFVYQSGTGGSLRIGRGWQYRNWYIFGIFGGEYRSAKTNQMWYGIDSDEATARYPSYNAESTFNFSSQLGFIRPINENWVLRGYIGYSNTPASASKSSLVEDEDTSYSSISVNRVF